MAHGQDIINEVAGWVPEIVKFVVCLLAIGAVTLVFISGSTWCIWYVTGWNWGLIVLAWIPIFGITGFPLNLFGWVLDKFFDTR